VVFSSFDLGLSRALTKLVAEKMGAGRSQELPALIWTAMVLVITRGSVGMMAVSLLSPLKTRKDVIDE
jgi:hypothetical protein